MREKTAGWLVAITYQRTMVLRIPRMAMAGHVTTNISDTLTTTIPRIRQSMPDSKALNPVSEKSHSKEALRARPVWTVYSIALGTPDKPANHTNRECWVFKLAGKLNAENKDKRLHSDDEEEPRQPNTR